MGKQKDENSFIIIVNNIQPVYYPGQKIEGYVRLDITEPLEVTGIRIKLVGSAYCFWSVRRKRKNYYGKQQIVKDVIQMFGHPPNDVTETYTLPKGNHVYHFSIDLPKDLPSTFEFPGAYIRYFLKGVVNVASDVCNDYKTFQPVIVNDVVDINDSIYDVARHAEVTSAIGCRRPFGRVDLEASIERWGFCPGETIMVNAGIQNRTKHAMRSLNIKLLMVITLNATTKTKTITKEVCRVRGPAIPAGQQARWVGTPLGIPALPPSINNSDVIRVNYKIEVKAKTYSCRTLAPIHLDIILGSVPNLATFGKIPDPEVSGEPAVKQPEANFIGGPLSGGALSEYLGYPDMVPPCLSAVVGSKSQIALASDLIKNVYGNIYYRPVYTFAQPHEVGHLLPASDNQYLESGSVSRLGSPEADAEKQKFLMDEVSRADSLR